MRSIVILSSCEHHFIRVHGNLVQHPSNNILLIALVIVTWVNKLQWTEKKTDSCVCCVIATESTRDFRLGRSSNELALTSKLFILGEVFIYVLGKWEYFWWGFRKSQKDFALVYWSLSKNIFFKWIITNIMLNIFHNPKIIYFKTFPISI